MASISAQNPLFLILGKLGNKDQKNQTGTDSSHLLIYHSLDVAAVALILWDKVIPASTKSNITNLLDQKEQIRFFIPFTAALHDLGKFTPMFQDLFMKKDKLYNDLLQKFDLTNQSIQFSKRVHHSILSYSCLGHPNLFQNFSNQQISQFFKLRGPTIGSWMGKVLAAHHGIFHDSITLNQRINSEKGNENWANLRCDFVSIIYDLIVTSSNDEFLEFLTTFQDYISNSILEKGEISKNPTLNSQITPISLAVWLAGLICVADWIGSNPDYFPHIDHCDSSEELNQYWIQAQIKAQKVIKELAWEIPQLISSIWTFQSLFNFQNIRPLQEVCTSVVKDNPGCVIIEAPMGEGKTEAAMFLAANSETINVGNRGIYFALPTQATSNQMFTRMKDFAQILHKNKSDAFNILLLHGHASLQDEFTQMPTFSPKNISDDEQETTNNNESIPIASQWFTYNKRGLLSPYGVGTIDQALIGILQTKHFFIRMFGLVGKTLVLDEVHAYDTYMSELIERLIEWVGALGGNIIILSATLPRIKRESLIEAFARGRNIYQQPISQIMTPYPRITWINSMGNYDKTFATSKLNHRQITCNWISNSIQDIRQVILKMTSDQGCVAIICNTVAEAQEYYHQFSDLTKLGYELVLFHSRFRVQDRMKIEKEILAKYGKPGPGINRPKKAIVISTQVIEQSLDLDFDLMFSVIAPIDLLLQRIGRLHRHQREQRPIALQEPQLFVIIPDLHDPQSITLQNFKKYDKIYHSHILLRTWLTLNQHFICSKRAIIKIPEDIDEIINLVYDLNLNKFISKIQSGLSTWDNQRLQNLIQMIRTSNEDLKTKQNEAKNQAKFRLIPSPWENDKWNHLSGEKLQEDKPELHEFHQASTRLIGPNINLIILFPDECRLPSGRKVDLKPVSREDEKWLLNRGIQIAHPFLVFELKKVPIPSEWEQNVHLKFHRCLKFIKDPTSNDDFYYDLTEKIRLHYRDNSGLIIDYKTNKVE